MHSSETLYSRWREIFGVAAVVRVDGVGRTAPPIVYWPLLMANFQTSAHWAQRGPAFVIRSRRTGSAGFAAEIGQAVWSVNANLPLANVRTLQRSAKRRWRDVVRTRVPCRRGRH